MLYCYYHIVWVLKYSIVYRFNLNGIIRNISVTIQQLNIDKGEKIHFNNSKVIKPLLYYSMKRNVIDVENFYYIWL